MFNALLFDRFTAIVNPPVSFEQSRCLRARCNNSNCLDCVGECQSDALVHSGKNIIFNEEKCSGCLMCVSICPNDAFVDEIDIKLFLTTVRDKENAVLSCKKGRQCEGKILIPCVGFLSETLLAVINALANKEVSLDLEPCKECVNGHCQTVIHKRLSSISQGLPDGTRLRIKMTTEAEDLPGLDRKTARRFFLRKAGKAIADISTEIAGTKMSLDQDESEKRKSPARDQEALNIALEHSGDKNLLKDLKPYFYQLTASKECTRCPLCSGMCPAGALKRKNKGEERHLFFTSSNCSGCGLCVEFCKKNALTLQPGVEHSPLSATLIA